MGRVWRAADEMLDRQVAVKEMRIDGLDAEDTRTRRERTLREARATARIDHPNVVRVYDVVDEGERLWIVMELIAGRSLERIMAEEGPLIPLEAARIGLGLVAALRQVHARGVLHRDIKPGNVLVETGGQRVVLTDFGIAAIQDAKALTMVGMLVGSPDYMAPERVSGRPQGPPSDVWSLGATLCAALGGRSPFSRDTTLATLHAVLYEEPELPAAAGPLSDILAALLEKDPSVRPALEEVEATLEPVAFPAPTPTLPVGGGVAAGAVPEEGSDVRHDEAGEPEPAAPRESPTPAYLETRIVRAVRDPRQPETQYEPESEPEPVPEEPTTHAEAVEPVDRPATRTPNASTEVPSEVRSEVRSETPAADSRGSTPQREGVSLTRAQAETQRRPGGHGPRPVVMPPGELPGPAVPARPRRTRRRSGLVALAGVVVAGAVVGIVLAVNSGSRGDTAGGSSSSSASSASSSPSATVEGTSRPQTLPPGAHREAGGYAWATPKGWRRDVKTGAEVHYTSPDGTQELAAKSALARGDLMQTWQTSEQNARQGQDYQKIRLENTTYRGRPAVVWEYTFTLKGVPWHARLLGFNQDGKSYQINTWYQPDTESRALKTYTKVRDSFTVL
jgi:serine/threonine protein kinase